MLNREQEGGREERGQNRREKTDRLKENMRCTAKKSKRERGREWERCRESGRAKANERRRENVSVCVCVSVRVCVCGRESKGGAEGEQEW